MKAFIYVGKLLNNVNIIMKNMCSFCENVAFDIFLSVICDIIFL